MTRRRRWPLVLVLVVLCLAGSIAALMYWDPFWVVDRSLSYFLRTHGVTKQSVAVGPYTIHYLEAKPLLHPAAPAQPRPTQTGAQIIGSAESGHGQPILLIHGLGARATDWSPVIPQLAANGYHVYAIDLLGYGDSPRPSDGDYTLAGEEKIVLGFMQAMHLQQADVAGWSMGGWLAMKVALDHPEAVHKLLLYDSAGLYFAPDFPLSLFAPTNKQELEQLIHQIEPDKPFIKVPGFAAHGMIYQMSRTQPIVDASFRSMLTGNELLDFRVHDLKMPVLIVWGTEDKLIPMSVGLRLHELIPQSRFVGIGGCGHLTVAECSKQAVPVTLQFLAADPPEPPSTTFLQSLR